MTTSTIPTAPGSCSGDGEPLAWQRRCMTYTVEEGGVDDLSHEDVLAIVAESLSAWTDLECDGVSPGFELNPTEVASLCDFAEYNQDAPNMNNIAFVSASDWVDGNLRNPPYDPNAYALTTVWHNIKTGEILDADMEINERRGNPYTSCPVPAGCTDGTSVDLENVVTHEMGHFFGLGHTSDANATMYLAAPPGEVSKRILRTDDWDGFCAVYPQGSLPDECDATPNGGLTNLCWGDQGTKKDDDTCGCAVPGASTDSKQSWLVACLGLAVAARARSTRKRAREQRAARGGCATGSRL